MLSMIPAGSTIRRVYYAVPGHSTIGDRFRTWDEAVEAAQERLAQLTQSLTETLGGWATPEEIAETASVQVRVDLRWDVAYPEGGGCDVVAESFRDVAKLRTRKSLTKV